MEPYSFPSQTFYNSNSSDHHRQYEAHDDSSIEVIGGEEIRCNEYDVQNMQYDPNVGDVAEFGDSNVLDESDIGIETGDDIQNEERSESRVSEVSLGSVTLTEYLNKDKNPESDYDISIHSDSDVSEYIPTEKEIKMAEKELKMELSDNKKKSKPKNKSKKRKNNFNETNKDRALWSVHYW